MSILWPRLERPAAVAVLDALRTVSPVGLARHVGTSHPAQHFASTGGGRAADADLQQVRSTILACAQTFGFPDPASPDTRVRFDRALAPVLVDVMPMVVGEALNRAVWNFTSLVLAPDVTHWRFGFGNTERWVCSDRTRHMYARLWWQAHQLTRDGADGRDSTLLDRLSESDLNQLLERTSIGGCRPLVMALARAIVNVDVNARSRELVREASLRLLRLTAVVDPYGLLPDQLDSLAQHVVDEARAALNSSRWGQPP